MAQRGYDALFVPRADEYLGEYLPQRNERLRWLSGFTGSAGMLLVLADTAALFVDGRYTEQARRQCDAGLFSLHHLIDAPPATWLAANLVRGARAACDPRLHSCRWFDAAAAALEKAGVELVADADNLVAAVRVTNSHPAFRWLPLVGGSSSVLPPGPFLITPSPHPLPPTADPF